VAEENRMQQHLQKLCMEKGCRINVFRTILGKVGQRILCTPQNLPAVILVFSSVRA